MSIFFQDKPLESVAPVKVVDITVAPVQMQTTVRDRPINAGAEFVRRRDSTRSVEITFAILEQDNDMRVRSLQNVYKWARLGVKGRLRLPNYDGYLNAVCTALPSPSLRMWWESKLRLTFTCYDPYWYDDYEHSVACGTEFVAIGGVPPLMRIENTFAASASNVAYSDGTHTMTFSTVPAGKLVIDLENQTAAVDGVSIMDKYTFGSSFIMPYCGNNTITGTGTVFWRERWV